MNINLTFETGSKSYRRINREFGSFDNEGELGIKYLYSEGYNWKTMQWALKFMIRRKGFDIQRAAREIEECMKHIKVTEDRGEKVIGIFEDTLSEFGVHYLTLKEDKYNLVIWRQHREASRQVFESLDHAINHIYKHHWYK